MAVTQAPMRLTSLLLVEERLAEADFFARRFARAQPDLAGYFLNAFLSAARSVTFLLQKEMAHVDGFASWWAGQRSMMAADKVARFFLELRNFSQKQGRVSLVSARTSRPQSSAWEFRFVGAETAVPRELLGVDAAEACIEHIAKLARIVLACMEAFPFHTCARSALTPEGVQALGLKAPEIFEAFGFPYVAGEDELAWRVIREEVDAVDVHLLRKFAKARLRRRPPLEATASDVLTAQLLSAMERRFLDPNGAAGLLEMVSELLDAGTPWPDGESKR